MNYQLGKNLMGAKFCAGQADYVYVVCYEVDETGSANPDKSFVVEASPVGSKLIGVFDYDLAAPVFHASRMILCDMWGNLHQWVGGEWEIEDITQRFDWYVTKLRVCSDRLLALGTNRTLLERDTGQWNRVLPATRGISLFDAVSYDDSVYMCGTKAMFGRMRGSALTEIDLPMASAITSLLPKEDVLLLTGWKAFAAVYDQDELSILDVGERKLTIYNSVEWQGETYLSTTHDVARLVGMELETVADFDSKRLCTTNDYLWSLGKGGLHISSDGAKFEHLEVQFEL